MHTFEGFVEIKRNEDWLWIPKILAIVHSIVGLILESIEVTDGPFYFEPVGLSLLIMVMLLHLLRDIHSFTVELQRRKFITSIESFCQFICALNNLVMLWFVQNGNDRAIHDPLLHDRFNHILFILLTKDRLNVLGVDNVSIVQLLEVRLIIEHFAGDKLLLIIDLGVIITHILHDSCSWRHLPLDSPALGQECLDLWSVLLDVVVVDVALAIDVISWHLVQV